MLPSAETARGWIGMLAVDVHGTRLGHVSGVLVDPETGEGRWISVQLGRLGGTGRHVMVPLEGLVVGNGRCVVPYPRRQVVCGVRHLRPEPLSAVQEHLALRQYGLRPPHRRPRRWERRAAAAPLA